MHKPATLLVHYDCNKPPAIHGATILQGRGPSATPYYVTMYLPVKLDRHGKVPLRTCYGKYLGWLTRDERILFIAAHEAWHCTHDAKSTEHDCDDYGMKRVLDYRYGRS